MSTKQKITPSIFPGFLTTSQVAAIHGVTRGAVCLWIKKRQLPSVRQGSVHFIDEQIASKFSPPPEGNPTWRLRGKKNLRRK